MNIKSTFVFTSLIVGSTLALSAGSAKAESVGQFDFVGFGSSGPTEINIMGGDPSSITFSPGAPENIIGSGSGLFAGFSSASIYDILNIDLLDTSGPTTPKGDVFIDLGMFGSPSSTEDGEDVIALKEFVDFTTEQVTPDSVSITFGFMGHFLESISDTDSAFGATGVLTFQVSGDKADIDDILNNPNSEGQIVGATFSGITMKLAKDIPESSPTAGLVGLGLIGAVTAFARKRKKNLV